MRYFVFVFIILFSLAAKADEFTIFYGGIGPSDDENHVGQTPSGERIEQKVDDNPFSFGVIHKPFGREYNLGIDVAGEGVFLDSTYGQDSLKQAMSVNLLVGTKLSENANWRLDGSLIIGARQSVSDCPDSNVEYQCYQDRAPDTEHKFNGGVLLMFSFEKLALGIRGTGESTQALVGFKF
jgi:hypothetical protein